MKLLHSPFSVLRSSFAVNVGLLSKTMTTVTLATIGGLSMRRYLVGLFCALLLLFITGLREARAADGFASLFPQSGVPKGWTVRQWNDLSKPAGKGAVWTVKD